MFRINRKKFNFFIPILFALISNASGVRPNNKRKIHFKNITKQIRSKKTKPSNNKKNINFKEKKLIQINPKNKKVTFDDLPNELKNHIVNYLPTIKDINSFSKTSRSNNQIVMENSLPNKKIFNIDKDIKKLSFKINSAYCYYLKHIPLTKDMFIIILDMLQEAFEISSNLKIQKTFQSEFDKPLMGIFYQIWTLIFNPQITTEQKNIILYYFETGYSYLNNKDVKTYFLKQIFYNCIVNIIKYRTTNPNHFAWEILEKCFAYKVDINTSIPNSIINNILRLPQYIPKNEDASIHPLILATNRMYPVNKKLIKQLVNNETDNEIINQIFIQIILNPNSDWNAKKEILEFLLLTNKINVNYENHLSLTPLMAILNPRSTIEDTKKAFNFLKRNGANINHENKYGLTFLMQVIRLVQNVNTLREILNIFINKFEILNYENRNGETVLTKTCTTKILQPEQRYPLIDYLIKNGAEISYENKRGNNVFTEVCLNSNIDIQNKLYILQNLTNYPINLNYENQYGETFLIKIIQKNNLLFSHKKYIIDILCHFKKINLNYENKYGITPLIYICMNKEITEIGKIEWIKFFKSINANVNYKNQYGNTLFTKILLHHDFSFEHKIHLLITLDSKELYDKKEKHIVLEKIVLSNKLDIKQKKELIQYLVKYNFNNVLNIKNKNGFTLLEMCINSDLPKEHKSLLNDFLKKY
ncbi:F-box protein [Candidatus Dependentiae bacterium]